MFWDKVAFIYDLFADLYNKKTHENLCRSVEKLIEPSDKVLECACGTGMLTVRVVPRCRLVPRSDDQPLRSERRDDRAKRIFDPRSERLSAAIYRLILKPGIQHRRIFSPFRYDPQISLTDI